MKHCGLTTDRLEPKVSTSSNYKCLKWVAHLTGLHGKITRPRHEGQDFGGKVSFSVCYSFVNNEV